MLEQFTIGCILAHSWHGHLARVHGLEGRATRSQPFVKCSNQDVAVVQPGVCSCAGRNPGRRRSRWQRARERRMAALARAKT